MFKPDNTTSTFAVHVKGPVTYCFGAGRDAYSKTVLTKNNVGADLDIPGPGAYDPLKPLGYNALKFKLKSRVCYDSPEKVAERKNVPPPGAYEEKLMIRKDGKYNFNSEWLSSKAAKWAP